MLLFGMATPNERRWTQFTCTTQLFRCHVILTGEEIAHLSFAAEARTMALDFLNKNNITVGQLPSHLPLASRLREILSDYAAGRRHTLPAPYLDSPFWRQGTPFQRRVWTEIGRIPYGTTRTYGELAARLGNPGCARAVGQACHANPLALVIPCHRVVAAHGLGGFAADIEIKQGLLALEKSAKNDAAGRRH